MFREVGHVPPKIGVSLGFEQHRDHLINDTLASELRRFYRLVGRTK